jgi:hypothetical protein
MNQAAGDLLDFQSWRYRRHVPPNYQQAYRCFMPTSVLFLLVLLFNPECECDMILRNIGWLSTDCTAVPAACFMLIYFLVYPSALKTEVICSSETSVDFQRTTWPYTAEDKTRGKILSRVCVCVTIEGNTSNYSAIANLHKSSQHPLNLFSRSLATASNREDSSSFLHRLTFNWQLTGSPQFIYSARAT